MTATTTTTRQRPLLPHLSDRRFLTDGGLETTLVFHDGIDLPEFAAFVLLDQDEGRAALERYFRAYLEIAEARGLGFVLDTPTWRASWEWGAKLGYDRDAVARVNRDAVAAARALAAGFPRLAPVVISGVIGPRGDGYNPETLMSSGEARAYHGHQAAALAEGGADLISAITMTHSGEAMGVALAARDAGLASVVSFTVETDGRLPSGETIGEAIATVDAFTGSAPAYYMINCAHPDHFAGELAGDQPWKSRIRGIRANASRMSHAELDCCETLDAGDPDELCEDYRKLSQALPGLAVMGGCCGTDHRHAGRLATLLAA